MTASGGGVGKRYAPRGLEAEGKRLWVAFASEYELRVDEQILLANACRTADLCDALQRKLASADVLDARYNGRVHPALPELRQQRLALTRMLALFVWMIPTSSPNNASVGDGRMAATGLGGRREAPWSGRGDAG